MEAKIKLKTKDTKVKVKAASLQGALGKLARLKNANQPTNDGFDESQNAEG